MDTQRNNYGEVCVYCHTPHGANRTLAAPLWNRTNVATTYQTYNLLNTSSWPIRQAARVRSRKVPSPRPW